MTVDWLSKLGKAGFQILIKDTVENAIQTRIEPRLDALETRLNALENRMAALEISLNTLAGVEQRLGISDRVAKLEAEVAQLKSRS